MNQSFFANWFDKLVKNKMGGAALPIAGMALGYGIVQASRIAPSPYDSDVANLGVRLMQGSAGVFFIAMLGFAVLWLIHLAKKMLN